MKVNKSLLFIFHILILFYQIYMVLSSSVRKDEMNIMDFFPSNSLLYPLDFQKNWQASEPIPLNIHYSVPFT
ncbi:hypothetical protein PFNF54_05186 [Plasmodium falciparum NF54]|uniref:Uncharacterized protein n=1 Tax=Plasmodium falciparum (isolate NF54) TaxID=5843 RepID=W7K8D3_PLAFO|nr:hypothetical protein PFNF54_05186 [Plasmodium falciparum NF54]